MLVFAFRCFFVMLAAQGTLGALAVQQARPEEQWVTELTSRVFSGDRTWEWIPAMDNRPGPFVKSEKRVLVGSWRKVNGDGFVGVSIYVVDTDKDAQQWATLHAPNADAKEWTLKPSTVGDGGWRAEHAPTGQIQLSLRRRLYVVEVSGKDAGLVDRFATQITAYIDAISKASLLGRYIGSARPGRES